jgi:hypothetical protein
MGHFLSLMKKCNRQTPTQAGKQPKSIKVATLTLIYHSLKISLAREYKS